MLHTPTYSVHILTIYYNYAYTIHIRILYMQYTYTIHIPHTCVYYTYTKPLHILFSHAQLICMYTYLWSVCIHTYVYTHAYILMYTYIHPHIRTSIGYEAALKCCQGALEIYTSTSDLCVSACTYTCIHIHTHVKQVRSGGQMLPRGVRDSDTHIGFRAHRRGQHEGLSGRDIVATRIVPRGYRVVWRCIAGQTLCMYLCMCVYSWETWVVWTCCMTMHCRSDVVNVVFCLCMYMDLCDIYATLLLWWLLDYLHMW